jgi:hypothetical protein
VLLVDSLFSATAFDLCALLTQAGNLFIENALRGVGDFLSPCCSLSLR